MNLINIEQLTLSYGNVIALKNVSMEINRGEVVTIVGPNGSGKTSLLKAIIGAVHPVEGSISVKPGLKIGYVPQRLNLDPTLPISVGRFMRLTERLDRSTCESYLKKAGVAGLIDQQMSELSGGQFQRVLLARALLGNPDILILDEATSSLDTESESKVQGALKQLTKNKTTLVIAHRLSTTQSADKIFVMKKGKIVSSGKHQDLLNSCEEYKNLYSKQLK